MIVIMLTTVFTGCNRIGSINNKPSSLASNINSSNENNSSKTAWGNSNIPEKVTEKDYSAVFDKRTIKTFLASLSDGTLWLPIAISNDEICGFTGAVKSKPSKIVVYNIATGKSTAVFSLDDKFQPEFIQFSSTNILLTEYIPNSNDDTGKQKAVLFNRSTGKVRILGTSKNSSSGDIQIALGSDYALWSYGTQGKAGNTMYCIYSYNFKTLQTTLFKQNAYMPVIGNNFIAWLGPSQENSGYNSLYYQDTTSNKITTISSGINPTYLAAYGDKLVFSGRVITSSAKETESALVLLQNGKQVIIEESKEYDYEFPVVSNNYISWDENLKKRVYSVGQNTIIDLPSVYGEAFVSDKYIMWGSDAIVNESKEQAQKDGIYKTNINLICTTANR
jgi:hypothetical protein